MTPKTFVRYAWAGETLFLVLYTAVAFLFMSTDRLDFWLSALPKLEILIAAQGAAVSIGPLVKRKIGGEG
jgi:hypothetical protein